MRTATRTRWSALDGYPPDGRWREWGYGGYQTPSVRCDACGSPPGRPCFGNGWMRRAHWGRVQAAAAQEVEARVRDAETQGFLIGAAAARTAGR